MYERTVSFLEPSTSVGDPTIARPSIALVALFGTTIFLGAFLLFLVEPMVAKMVLPILGGTPMVWNTCVLFFQVTLLAGYAYAHGAVRRLGLRRHAFVYASVLLIPLISLPFTLRAASDPPAYANPIPWLLGVLILSIGLPFFALSTGASVLQHTFSRSPHRSARDPYFLYAASNVGSLLALLAYPVVVEPMLRVRDQTRLWSLGYTIFIGLALVCVAMGAHYDRTGDEAPSAEDTAVARESDALTWARRARWLTCAFIPSSLMLGVTSYLSTDIAPIPLLWVVPLALYLLTFVVAFGVRRPLLRTFADRGLPLLIVPLAMFMLVHAVGPTWLIIPIHLPAFTLAAFLCHADLAGDRPSAAHLTEFYFWVAFGGMIGGVFNTLVAPIVFSSIIEYPLVLVVVCLLRQGQATQGRPAMQRALDAIVPLGVGVLTAGLVVFLHRRGADPRLALALLGIAVFSQAKRPLRFALSVAAFLLAGLLVPNANTDGTVLHRERTFFGVYRVNLDSKGEYRSLFHGTTLHGMQALDRKREGESLTYFHRTGPFGQMFAQLPQVRAATRVAVVGLGVGSLASYAGPAQQWTFYEIDPAVERIARNSTYFTFLERCNERCRVVLGDARLSLARESDARYGLIVLDAFSSDSIPIHLMTSEAMALYMTRLAPGGVLAFHISNRHLRLGPIVGRLALTHGLTALEQSDWVGADVRDDGKTSSNWVVMTRNRVDLDPLLYDSRWRAPAVSGSTPLWTDDFSNILGVLAFFREW